MISCVTHSLQFAIPAVVFEGIKEWKGEGTFVTHGTNYDNMRVGEREEKGEEEKGGHEHREARKRMCQKEI
jgi:hypothetical protein